MSRSTTIACLSLIWLWFASGGRADDEPPVAVPQTREAIVLQNVYRFEKAFLVRACQLSEEQKREVQKLEHSWIEALPDVAKAAVAQGNGGGRVLMQNGAREIVILDGQNQQAAVEAATEQYRTALREKFGKVLTPVQREVYREELAARDEFRRHADAACLVAVLDNTLDLQPAQREALTQALAEWPGKDGIFISHFFQYQGFLPMIPENLLSKHLTPEQLSLYQTFPKRSVRRGPTRAVPPHEAFGE